MTIGGLKDSVVLRWGMHCGVVCACDVAIGLWTAENAGVSDSPEMYAKLASRISERCTLPKFRAADKRGKQIPRPFEQLLPCPDKNSAQSREAGKRPFFLAFFWCLLS